MIDRGGSILLANPRAADILQRPQGELEGARIDTVLTSMETLIEAADTSPCGESRYQCGVSLPGGRHVIIGFSISPVERIVCRKGGQQYVVVFQDISHWEKLREERNRLLQLATVNDVLPSILHELKNPLAAIASAIELLYEEIPEGRVQRDLYTVLSEIRRMKLTFEGIGSIGCELRSPDYNAVDSAGREAFHILEAEARKKGIRTRCEVRNMPLLPFNGAMVRAIIFNLVMNAIHACSEGDEVVLTAGLADRDRVFEMAVEDTGPGMDPDVRMRCKELFFTTRSNGSGIGLAFCNSAVEPAGGELLVEPGESGGTRVTVRVPIVPSERGVSTGER